MGGSGGAAGARRYEKVADSREDTDEPLQVRGQSKALPHTFAPPERQMRILCPIVEPLGGQNKICFQTYVNVVRSKNVSPRSDL